MGAPLPTVWTERTWCVYSVVMLIELAMMALLHTGSSSSDDGAAPPVVTVTRTCSDGAHGRVCRTSTRTVTGSRAKRASAKPAKPPVDPTVVHAAAVSSMTRIYVNTTPVAQVHQYVALGYPDISGVITVPTVVATQVAQMPTFPQ
jgi:hypothetical protein